MQNWCRTSNIYLNGTLCTVLCRCETCCLLQESSASVVTEIEAAVMEFHVCQLCYYYADPVTIAIDVTIM